MRKEIGKRVRGVLYVHRSAIALLSDGEKAALDRALERAGDVAWNVARISSGDVALLTYDNFDAVAFPTLRSSVKVELPDGPIKTTSYKDSASRPVLHRKELLLPPGDPRIVPFSALTRSAEEFGLFAEPLKIGSSGRWEQLLKEKGLEVHGAELVPIGHVKAAVHRHRTALTRRNLSQPVALALRLGMATRDDTIFDYGCGQGDDVAILRASGYDVFGWDPHFATDGDRKPAELVNLGFVLNVIESVPERKATLRDAWAYARRAMVVAVMTNAHATDVENWRPYKDGFLTSRGTFQKYYTQSELRAFVSEVLNEDAVPLSGGIVAVFKDKELEQAVRYRKRSFMVSGLEGIQVPYRPREPRPVAARPDLSVLAPRAIEDITRVLMTLGRAPAPDELPVDVVEALKTANVPPSRAIAFCVTTLMQSGDLAAATQIRRDELLLHFALSMFPGAPRYAALPRSIQLDVRAFFSSHNAMLMEARTFLFQLRDAAKTRAALDATVNSGLASWRGAKMRLAVANLAQTPPLVRLIAGCAEVLDPDILTADVLDIYQDGARVRGTWVDDFAKRLPVMRDRVDIDFSRLKVRRPSVDGRILYSKSSIMPATDPDRAGQLAFEARLPEAGIIVEDDDGPRIAQVRALWPQHPWLQD